MNRLKKICNPDSPRRLFDSEEEAEIREWVKGRTFVSTEEAIEIVSSELIRRFKNDKG
jgi:hypothetical protein